MKVVFLLPTIRDKKGIWKEFFIDKMIPTLGNLSGAEIDWAINFQQYENREIEIILSLMRKELGGGREIRFVKNDYPVGPVSFRRLRYDSAVLFPDADIFVEIDDDFKFSKDAGIHYATAIKYMEMYPGCGYLQCKGYLGGYKFVRKIVPTIVNYWATNRGLFLRNMMKEKRFLLYPDANVLSICGGLDEPLAVFYRMELGYYGAKMFNLPVSYRKMARHEEFDKYSKQENYRYNPEFSSHNPKNNEEMINYIVSRWGGIWPEQQSSKNPPIAEASFLLNCKDPNWEKNILEW